MNATASLEIPPQGGLKAKERGDFSYLDVQFAIEQLYDLRSKVIRIGLLGTLLHRPDPDRSTPQAEIDEFRTVLEAETVQMKKVVVLLETGQPFEGIHPEAALWMSKLAHSKPDELAAIQRVDELTQRVFRAALSGSRDQSPALIEHRRVARTSFHTAVTGLCLFMWQSYDKDQSHRLDRAQEAAAALGDRLTRLERIGTHVRLVSLNASVEASHIGDKGRGLSVIAQEFKGLAEEVKKLAQEARLDVDQMRDRD